MRPDILNPLFTEVTALKGVGEKLAKPLEKLGITRLKDLAYHFPRHWRHRVRVESLDEALEGRHIIITLKATEYRSGGSQRAPTRIHCQDAVGNHVSIVYFGRVGKWARGQFPLGEQRVVAGKLERYGDEWQMVHPEHVTKPGESGDIAVAEPVYAQADGITSQRLASMVETVLTDFPELDEWIDPGLLSQKNWRPWRDSLRSVHTASDGGEQDKDARDRLAYDELFANQLAMQLVRAAQDRRRAAPLKGDGRITDALKLPFALTDAQRRSISEIEGDLVQERPMLRLLQGDVGSGKTLVAMLAMLRAVEAGKQAVLLAPTEILARQHAENLARDLSGLPVELAVLTGRDKGRAREATLMGLADGSIDILVGTHAVFQEAVTYRDLALVVIDEQHRFGVSQRLMLARKANLSPHLLAMTATPIPRTLTLAHYGEMDVSQIDELPPGRSPIDTRVISEERIEDIVAGLGRHIEAGKQAFWVCPLVEEGTTSDLAAAEDRAALLKARFGDKVGLVHGRMKGAEKDAVMEAFQRGDLSVLVATTVIEVGVNVPNASLMIVEKADFFGLAQLHQLRGRVGRGDEASTCLLIRSRNLSKTARARLALLRETQDGFRIAEEDLRLRGGGELLGTRQSGEAAFAVAQPEQVSALIETASNDARLLIDRDGGLDGNRGRAARVALYLFERDAAVATLRSG